MEVDQGNTRLSDIISANEHQTEDNVTALPIELTNVTGTYLEHLNEDCLLEIFSNNSLTWMDLCSLAETCSRFEQITQRVFPKHYMIGNEYCRNEYCRYEFRSKNCTENFYENLQDVKRILKNFGSHLTELVIWRKDQDLVNLVGMYCGDVILNHLNISNSESIEDVKTHMNSILQRLRQLTFFSCDFHEVTSQNLNFDALIVLRIEFSSGCVAILKQTFPNLKRFSWRDCHVYTKESNNATHLYEFIRRHRHLEAINVSDSAIRRSRLLFVIDSNCKELKNLRLNCFWSSKASFDFSTQGGLSKLKMLGFKFEHDNDNENISLLQAAKLSLETIKISSWNGRSLQIFEVLSQLQNLRELHLTFCPFHRVPWTMLTRLKKVYLQESNDGREFDSTCLPNVISQLINLEELEYNYYNHDNSSLFGICPLRKDDFTKIVKIVEQREHVLTLKCLLFFDLKEICNENQKVKLIEVNLYSDDEDEIGGDVLKQIFE